MNFVDDFILEREKSRIFLVKGVNEVGLEVFYLLLVYKHKLVSFMEKSTGSKYKVTDYGKILYHGYGHQLPKKLREKLKISIANKSIN